MDEVIITLLKEQIELRDKIIDDYKQTIDEIQKRGNKTLIAIVALLMIFFSISVLSYFWSDYTVTTNNVTTTGDNNSSKILNEGE